MARQLPDSECELEIGSYPAELAGGIIRSCDDPYIRVDAMQHWINGAAAYLELMNNMVTSP